MQAFQLERISGEGCSEAQPPYGKVKKTTVFREKLQSKVLNLNIAFKSKLLTLTNL